MKAPTNARADRGGMTILEVLCAMMVLMVGMTSILGFFSFGTALSRTARLKTEVAQSIEAVMADLEESFFPLVLDDLDREVPGEPVPIVNKDVPGYPNLVYSATGTLNPDTPLGTPGVIPEYRVDVEVAWKAGGQRRTREFTTVLLREVPFGERMRRRFIEGIEPEPAPSND